MFGEIESLLSLVCSGAALLSTGYFWLVRNNQERQNLSIQTLQPLRGSVVLVQEDDYPYQHLLTKPDGYWARYRCSLVIVNNSVLPNSALSMRAWLASPDGSWIDAHCRIADSDSLPITLPPSATIRVEAQLYLPVADRGRNREERVAQAMAAIHPDCRVRIKVRTLSQKDFQFDITAQPLQVDPLMRIAERTAA